MFCRIYFAEYYLKFSFFWRYFFTFNYLQVAKIEKFIYESIKITLTMTTIEQTIDELMALKPSPSRNIVGVVFQGKEEGEMRPHYLIVTRLGQRLYEDTTFADQFDGFNPFDLPWGNVKTLGWAANDGTYQGLKAVCGEPEIRISDVDRDNVLVVYTRK